MSDEMKDLLERLSKALSELLHGSEEVKSLMQKIEERGSEGRLTLAIVLGVENSTADLQQIVYNSKRKEKGGPKRVTAFDKRFLRALRIELPE